MKAGIRAGLVAFPLLLAVIPFVTRFASASETAMRSSNVTALDGDHEVPETCRLDLPVQVPPISVSEAENVEKTWARALGVVVTLSRQLVRTRGGADADKDNETQRRKRKMKIMLMHSSIVPHQQQIFIALGPEGHGLAVRLAKQLDGCVDAIRRNL
ncbi:hypothetical protein [Nisaea sp.]|uniref:hypothetical protein n=1 Tax=Nisaea sp. TaxID=2024842 RepID=UPI0032657385